MKRTIHDMRNWLGVAAKALVVCLAVSFAGAVSAATETKNGVGHGTATVKGNGSADVTIE